VADRAPPKPDALCDPPNLSTLWGRVLIDELARSGVRHAVIAPGSRSTPLAFAAADHPDVSDLSVIDERSAAFVALGLARATGWPAVVISTSGTAAANFLPAVTEADRAGIPLLVLTADRPARLRDAGDSQTTDQVKLFGGRVRWFHETPHPGLGPGREEATLRALRSAAAHAWAQAAGTGGPPGPVHLNVPLDKPLEPAPAAAGEPGALPDGFDPAGAAAGRPGGAPWLRPVPSPLDHPSPPSRVSVEGVERVALALAGARRPLVLVGAMASAGVPGVSDRLRHAVARLAERLALPVWAEATSGLRFAHETGDRVIGTGELLLASERFRERLTGNDPGGVDLVLRLGEAPIGWGGRRLAAELAAAGVLQIAVDPWGRRHDPDHGVAWTVAAEPGALLGAVADLLERRGVAGAAEESWIALHREADQAARAVLAEEAARRSELFDGGVFWHLGSLLPDDAALVVSSSMPLREVEMFLPAAEAEAEGAGRVCRTVDLFANRGLNGIDGITSTALGVALGRWVDPGAGRAEGGSRTVLVTGDVAFAHDLSGALAAGRLQGARADLTVVLVNNDGGAIFDHLPAAGREPAFTRHLSTPTGADFAALARGCGLEHRAPGDWKGFRATIADTLATPGCRVVEVRTDRARSKAIREEIAAAVAAAVDRTLGKPATREPATAVAAGGERSRTEPARPGAPCHPGGAPLVLLHGFTGSAADWQAWPPRVAWHPGGDHLGALFGRPALALDLPGHGASPGAGGATMDAAVEEILAALDRRGIDRAHLVGYSMGGRAALAFAAGHPDRLASLMLIGASPGIEDDAERSERRRQDEALARALEEADAGGGLEGFVDRWMALPLFATQALLGHRHLRLARLRRLAGSSRGYAASLRGMGQGAQASYWPALQTIETPTLLLAGGRDERYVRLAHRMAEAMPHARVEIVPGVGHAAHLEAPDAVAEAIRGHVEGVEQKG